MRISQNTDQNIEMSNARVEVDDTHLGDSQTNETVARSVSKERLTTQRSAKERDAEISRLTWAVLDGKATDSERKRLAELVSAQRRRRFD